MMHELISSLAVWLAAILGVVIALAGAWFRGKAKGRQDAEQAAKVEQTEKLQSTIRERSNVESDINRLPSGGAAERLRERYSRD